MNEVRQAFLDAATAASTLLDHPQVGTQWDDPGASEGMTVGGIAAHLVQSGIESLQNFLEAPEPQPSGRLLAPGRYFSGQSLDLEHDDHRSIRDSANAASQVGLDELRHRAATAISTLTTELTAASDDRLVLVLGRFTMTLDDLTITRLVELLAHSDDLASSLGINYDPPQQALTIVLACLTDVARRRHGDLAVLRTVARGGRVSEPVFPVF
jgi:Mycothiol maleylpyruvate isomerase N-terminal domain